MTFKFESVYSKTFKSLLWLMRPFKRALIRTECKVHVFINNQALSMLENDGYDEAFAFYSTFKKNLNGGAVWADQDFRSRNHFYNPYTQRGLYGCESSMDLFRKYYKKAISYYRKGEYEKGIFYLGAAVHLIQDSTIPQHASIHLMKSHRKYEQWIKRVHDNFSYYAVSKEGLYLNNPYQYIVNNSQKSLSVYRKYQFVDNRRKRFKMISLVLFPLAQKSTAGCLINFYNSVVKPNKESENSA